MKISDVIKWIKDVFKRFFFVILVVGYVAIYCAFYYHIGFPASQGQDSSALVLTASDWLAFLGSYLTFAGALIMAYLVYRQNEKITELTIADHEPKIALRISKILEEEKEKQPLFQLSTNYYPTLYCDGNSDYTGLPLFVFAEIINEGEMPINSISFQDIQFIEYDINYNYGTNNNSYHYEVKNKSEYECCVYPKQSERRCFRLDKFPGSTKDTIYVMKLQIKVNYGDKTFDEQVLVRRDASKSEWIVI